MAKNAFQKFTDTDTEIRARLIDKFTYAEIKKELNVSDKRISLVKKAMLSGDVIRRERVKRNPERKSEVNDRNESVPVERSPEQLETLRKDVEYKALAAMQHKLDTEVVEIKEATAILSVVGEKPKAQGDTVVMLINSVGNMAIAARQMLIEASRASKQLPVDDSNIKEAHPIDVTPPPGI